MIDTACKRPQQPKNARKSPYKAIQTQPSHYAGKAFTMPHRVKWILWRISALLYPHRHSIKRCTKRRKNAVSVRLARFCDIALVSPVDCAPFIAATQRSAARPDAVRVSLHRRMACRLRPDQAAPEGLPQTAAHGHPHALVENFRACPCHSRWLFRKNLFKSRSIVAGIVAEKSLTSRQKSGQSR